MKSNYETVVIEVSLNPIHYERIKDLAHSPILRNANNVHLVNIYDKRQNCYLPTELRHSNCDEVEEYVEDLLLDLLEEIIPVGANPINWHTHSFFSNDTKIQSREYLKEIGADLVITSTRGEQNTSGLFTDSFSYYLVSHAPCDVYVMTPEGHKGLENATGN